MDYKSEILKGPDHWNIEHKGTHGRIILNEVNLNKHPHFKGYKFVNVDFTRSGFMHSNLIDCNFVNCAFDNVDLGHSTLNSCTFEQCYGEELRMFNTSCYNVLFSRSSIIELDLSDSRHRNITFNGCKIHKCQWNDFKSSDFAFIKTSLSRIDMYYSNFESGLFEDCNFEGVKWGGNSFYNTSISNCKGLNDCTHFGPSSFDMHFISENILPTNFLRGIGLSDQFIHYIPSFNGRAIELYSCFISYSSLNDEFTRRLHADLQNKGVRCWFAPEDLKIGDRIRPAIDSAIRIHDKLLLVLSEHSIGSQWVEKEVETAFEKERKTGDTVLFPITLDDAVFDTDEAWAADLRRTRHIGDFRRWKHHDGYTKALDRLMQDLKAAS